MNDTRWRKSTYSASNGSCVEVQRLDVGNGESMTLVRHSRQPHGPVLRYTGPEWAAFLAGVKAGEFDQ